MHRMHRAAGILPILILALAACAVPGMGGGTGTDTTDATPSEPTETAAVPTGSATAGGDDTAGADVERVDITALGDDPAAFENQPVALLARVDEVLVEDLAFLTSPSGTEQGQFPVVITGDAHVDKEIEAGTVVWLEGTTVAFTAEDLEAAGVDVSAQELAGFDGEFVFVATTVADPLSRDDGGASDADTSDDSGGGENDG